MPPKQDKDGEEEEKEEVKGRFEFMGSSVPFLRSLMGGGHADPSAAEPEEEAKPQGRSLGGGGDTTADDMRARRLAALGGRPKPAAAAESPPPTQPQGETAPTKRERGEEDVAREQRLRRLAQTSTPTPAPAPAAAPAPPPARKEVPVVRREASNIAPLGYLVRFLLQVQPPGGDEDFAAPASLAAVFLGENREDEYRECGEKVLWARIDSGSPGPTDVKTLLDQSMRFSSAFPGQRPSLPLHLFGRLAGGKLAKDQFAQETLKQEIAVMYAFVDDQVVKPFADMLRAEGPAADELVKSFFSSSAPCGDLQATDAFVDRLVRALGEDAQRGMQRCVRDLFRIPTTDPRILLEHLRRITRNEFARKELGSLLTTESNMAQRWEGSRVQQQSTLRTLLQMPAEADTQALLQGIKNYPLVPPQEVSGAFSASRRSIMSVQQGMADILKEALLKKGEEGRNTVLKWFHAILGVASVRTDFSKRNLMRQKATSVANEYALNLAGLIVELALPVCQNEWGKKVESAYTASMNAIEAHPQWAVEATFGGAPLPASERQAGNFGFSTSIFAAAVQAMHVCVNPALREMRWMEEDYRRAQSMAAQHGPGAMQDPRLMKMVMACDSLRLLLLNPDLVHKLTQVAATQIRIALRDSTTVPVFFAADAIDWAHFVCRHAPDLLEGAKGADVILRSAVELSFATAGREPLIDARVVSLLAAVCLDHRQHRVKLADAWDSSQWSGHQPITALRSTLFGDPQALAALPTLLFRTYAAGGEGAGFDIDKDDHIQSARSDALGLFVSLIVQPHFRDALVAGLQREEEDTSGTESGGVFAHFVHAVVTEGTHCLDDALNRLIEVKDLEKARKDKATWDALPERERRQKTLHIEQQEMSARGFMHSAVRALNVIQMVLNPTRADPPPATPPAAIGGGAVMRSIAHMCRNFMAQLNGRRGEELRDLPDPKRFDYDRLGILQSLTQTVALLADTAAFPRAFALSDDYERWVISATIGELRRTAVGGGGLLGRLEKFAEMCHALNPQDDCPPVPPAALWAPPEGKVVTFDEKVFTEQMEDYVVGEVNISGGGDYGGFSFRDAVTAAQGGVGKEMMKKVKSDRKLMKGFPQAPQAAIFGCLDESRLDAMRIVISGPEGTPYAFGLFVFDVHLPANYPHCPPQCKLRTTGGGTVRFNPNLYESGKVCLSLLGTWHGDGEETKWSAEKSSIYQVAVSIQSMILVPDPYMNEPGNEAHRGTPEGEKWSNDYNEGLRLATLRHAILGNIESPPEGCRDLIHNYYRLLTPAVLSTAAQWTAESSPARKNAFTKVLAQLVETLQKLGQEGAAEAAGAVPPLFETQCAKWADPPPAAKPTARRGHRNAAPQGDPWQQLQAQMQSFLQQGAGGQQGAAGGAPGQPQQQQQQAGQAVDADMLAAMQAAGEDAALQQAIAMSLMGGGN
eukprot:Hpha_TRINITY_DN12898_c0_g2::TRINITY_DN12898_c0_g2_i1::g.24198::m.24198